MSNNRVRDLLIEGKHQEVISSFSEEVPLEVFCAISSYLSLGKYEDALSLLSKKKDALYQDNPLRTMKLDFELRFALKQFDEAEEDYEYFANLPYVSQEVEEYLREAPKLIRQEMRASMGKPVHDEDEILDTLKRSSNREELLTAMADVKNALVIAPFEDALVALCKSSISDDINTYAFMILSMKGYGKEVLLTKRGKQYRLIPKNVGMPYLLSSYDLIRKTIANHSKDPTLIQIASRLLDDYSIIRYPEIFVEAGQEETFAFALLALAKGYLGMAEEEKEEVKTLADSISKEIEATHGK